MTELLQMLKKRKYSEKNTIISQCTLGVDKIIPMFCVLYNSLQQRLWSQAAREHCQ